MHSQLPTALDSTAGHAETKTRWDWERTISRTASFFTLA
jgi:hypothetical protein